MARITNDGALSLQRAGRHPTPDFAPTRESHGDLESRHHRRPQGTAQAASSSPGQGLSPSPAGGLTDSQNRPGVGRGGDQKGQSRDRKLKAKRGFLSKCACMPVLTPSCQAVASAFTSPEADLGKTSVKRHDRAAEPAAESTEGPKRSPGNRTQLGALSGHLST